MVMGFTFIESEINLSNEQPRSDLPIQKEPSEVSEESFQANFEGMLL